MITVAGRERRLAGDLGVHRVLPDKGKRAVGPFVFLDHLGPVLAGAGQDTDVPPHPHIGLSTLTYLFAGQVLHRDSLGSVQLIEPGEVNWMTAGRGIAHSERTPPGLKGRERPLHGLQFWVALPDGQEDCEPAFFHYGQKSVPFQETGDYRLDLAAGKGFGLASPVQATSPLLFADVRVQKDHRFSFREKGFEMGVYVLQGKVRAGEGEILDRQMAVFEPGTEIVLAAGEGSRFVVIGGPPLATPRHVWWNFVSSSRESIEEAKRRWKEGLFARIPGETELTPLPE